MRVAVEILPALSLAVTVIRLLPLVRLIPKMLQLVVPVAVPLAPLSLIQVTMDTPILSEAVPDKEMVLVVVE